MHATPFRWSRNQYINYMHLFVVLYRHSVISWYINIFAQQNSDCQCSYVTYILSHPLKYSVNFKLDLYEMEIGQKGAFQDLNNS